MDIDTLNLLICGGLVLGSNQFSILPKLPQKNDSQLKIDQNIFKMLLMAS